jgi:aspartyl-tRNA(Asn)/glutamyl-tRNA(Gln) amidotransferase subunit A
VISGSWAAASFDTALADLAAHGLRAPRARVPFDYAPFPLPSAPTPWTPARASLLAEHHSPIVEAWHALRHGQTTARALAEKALASADEWVALGGLAERDRGALDVALRLDDELDSGVDRGPLHGIPITVKDVIDVAGVATRAGSAVYDEVPTVDATAVRMLRAAGAVIVGKAATHEFALGVTNPDCRNPHDPTRLAGGSSGGSAVCLVTGVGLGSLGTDTRASIRVPAALSGVVGLKPTYGRIPTDGVVALSWTMDHVAPMANAVTDAALMLDAILGGSSALAWTSDEPIRDVRVGVVTACSNGAEPGVVAAVDEAIEELARLGMRPASCDTPTDDDLAVAGAAGLVISRCEAAAAHRTLRLDRSGYWEEVRDQLDHADGVLAVDYLDAQRVRAELRDRLLACFADHDVLAMPTVPVLAPPIIDFARYLMLLARNAIPWSLVGCPAISVPVAPCNGLPVGLQLVAAPGQEALLVRVARAYESLSAPHGRGS